ncbi:SDR family NAD(P)-dependent oxidoreductase [Aestuariirhabdus litorea]|uniref:Dihydromonapterin reductase n=1 Tax=Aestuariirhabdus litorea TaxID=2528527 RepID=A0A3P3VKW4_9GAMM|nr:SDR family NAD(P)-dependent oxidoreductase [Aestuariirhabdus litorea]RRJ83365.1 SDR family NAD(P)-dependent oxidoreductase [Aestuariirhabdus litorea]RWW93524.1 SDR family NAD(P)-dependent oxidoreductase [Endozoicomonadaceae bacterium GTF-13]
MDEVVIITGAGTRVGLHCALRLKQQGYRVLAHYHSERPELEQLQHQGIPCLQADLACPEGIEQLAEELRQRCHSVRALVHNASAFETTPDDPAEASALFERFYRIHMLAPYRLNRALAEALNRSQALHSDIVHITDIFADNPNPAFDIYCASKAGLANLSLSFAKQLAPKVKVNAIAPGPIRFKEWHSEAVKQQIIGQTLLRSEGGEEAIYLALQALLDNPYTTGSTIKVDGGRSIAHL